MRLRLLVLAFAALMIAVPACGGGNSNYRVPVENPLTPFEKKDRAELTGEEPAGQGDADDDFTPAVDPDDGADGGDAEKPAPAAGSPAAK